MNVLVLLALFAGPPSKIDTTSKPPSIHLDSAATDTIWRLAKAPNEPLYSFRANKVPLSQALQLFSKANDINIESDSTFKNPITVDFRDARLDSALKKLLDPSGIAWELKGRSVRILGSATSRLFHIDYLRFKRAGSGTSQASISSSGSGQAGRMTVNTTDELQFWDELEGQIKSILTESGKLVTNRTAGTLWVKDAAATIQEVDRFISAVTLAVARQVEITARIYEVTLNDDRSLGIDWTKVGWTGVTTVLGNSQSPSAVAASVATSNIQSNGAYKPATLSADYTLGKNSIAMVLSALSEQGDVKSVSQPRIVTLNNQPALIKVGTDMPYFVATVTNNGTSGTIIAEDVRIITLGVVLSVTPQISANGLIQLGIEPLITSLVGTETSRYGSTAPIVDVKQSSSMATLRDRETVRLSGLNQETNSVFERKVPLLGDLPLLGALFRWKYTKKSNKELVIFVTPRILD